MLCPIGQSNEKPPLQALAKWREYVTDFDEAIRLGKEKGYKIAWSNQSFEYWLYLHFNYADTALHRDDWCEKLNEIFKQYNLGDGTYHKNCEEIFDLVNQYDGVNTAFKNAKRRMDGFREKMCHHSMIRGQRCIRWLRS